MHRAGGICCVAPSWRNLLRCTEPIPACCQWPLSAAEEIRVTVGYSAIEGLWPPNATLCLHSSDLPTRASYRMTDKLLDSPEEASSSMACKLVLEFPCRGPTRDPTRRQPSQRSSRVVFVKGRSLGLPTSTGYDPPLAQHASPVGVSLLLTTQCLGHSRTYSMARGRGSSYTLDPYSVRFLSSFSLGW